MRVFLFAFLVALASSQVADFCPPGNFDAAPCSVKLESYRCASSLHIYQKQCPLTGNTTFCPAGFYCPSSEPASVYRCPAGGLCLENTSCVVPCPVGFYCPDGSPEPCPSYHTCSAATSKPVRSIGTSLAVSLCLGLLTVAIGIGLVPKPRKKSLNELLLDRRRSETMGGRSTAVREDSVKESLVTKERVIPLGIECHELSMHITSTGERLLDEVTFSIKPGSLTCIMGPPGSGKHALMSLLSGKAWEKATHTGFATIGTMAITPKTIRTLRRVCGYVPREDNTLPEKSTVREILDFHASCRLPTTWSLEQKRNKVDQVLAVLELGHVQDRTIGVGDVERGISVNQRQRLSIGTELVTCPSLLFLDEPFHNLDTSTTLAMCDYFHKLANARGITILAVIHQQLRREAFLKFDQVILLAPGGSLVYSGVTSNMEKHFEEFGIRPSDPRQNLGDFFMDVLTSPLQLADAMILHSKEEASRMPRSGLDIQDATVPISIGEDLDTFFTQYPPVCSWWVVFWGSVWRFFVIQYLRSRQALLLDCLYCSSAVCGVAWLLPDNTWTDVQNHFALGSLVLVLFAHSTAASTLNSKERTVLSREIGGGLRLSAILAAKDICLIPRVVLLPTLFLLQHLFLNAHIRLAEFYVAYLGLSYAAFGSGLLLCAIFPEPRAGSLRVLLAMVFAALCGDRPPLAIIWEDFSDNAFFSWIGRALTSLSPIRWSFDLMVSVEYTRASEFQQLCHVGDMGPRGIDPSDSLAAQKLAALFMLGVGFRVVAFVMLWVRRKKEEGTSLLSALKIKS